MAERRNEQPPSDSRRKFLKYSGTAIGGAVVGGVIGGAIAGGFRKNPAAPAPAPTTPGAATQTADFNQAPMYFNQFQMQITEAAAERIYPKDDIGPGAAELGVAFFIDHQMASPWGINAREYRIGPFIKGEVTQGDYQIIQRNELFTMGLQAMEEASKKKYTKSFIDLTDEEKDAILTSMDKGEILVINEVTGKTFFNLLRRVTLEGVYSDPVYGGNKNMMGWKMRKYPGNQMVYTEIMEKSEFVLMEPRSLHDHFATH
ncbi:twin-arginine translocation signal domain-containing protein [Paenibacillus sp. LMG 31456]|uniref:Twin-arginine translocation signal domain-containing protein n=1 Tax=Paenibacillus foliorum TaxID=2654974 RepID=A0A972JZC8_9BACL|nr:gluconate 2-dehydrogenase subunit 3 family protein [Paenibacillus foliorum]NOU92605.1 twin-arginine translocation signal domain-containing protein [Paenibacillus foliorum]